MKKKQPDENKPEDALRLLHKRDSEELDNQTKRLIQALSCGGSQSTNEGSSTDGVGIQLDEIRILSRAWERLAKKKKNKDDEGLWNRLLDACQEAEIENLRRQGYSKKFAKQLVWVDAAWWDPHSRQFRTGAARPECRSSVQVVVVQRAAGIRIHEEILTHLWQHPVFSEELSRNAVRSPSEGFRNTLESVDAIAKEYDYDAWEYFPSLDELDDPDQSAVDCILKGLELRYLLESRDSGGGDFFGDDEPTKSEHLAWLNKAKKGKRLWKLLNAAVELGRTLNHYSTFRDTKIKETIRRLQSAYPGKGTSNAGKAVVRIISAARDDGLPKITPESLLTWLGGKKPYKIDDPLLVTHPLWGVELKDIPWKKFGYLVKSANRRKASTRN